MPWPESDTLIQLCAALQGRAKRGYILHRVFQGPQEVLGHRSGNARKDRIAERTQDGTRRRASAVQSLDGRAESAGRNEDLSGDLDFRRARIKRILDELIDRDIVRANELLTEFQKRSRCNCKGHAIRRSDEMLEIVNQEIGLEKSLTIEAMAPSRFKKGKRFGPQWTPMERIHGCGKAT